MRNIHIHGNNNNITISNSDVIISPQQENQSETKKTKKVSTWDKCKAWLHTLGSFFGFLKSITPLILSIIPIQ